MNVCVRILTIAGIPTLLALLSVPAAPLHAESPLETGLVVESVEKGGAAAKAGLLPGDRLLSWKRASTPPANPEPASGTLRSPFDLMDAETEQGPRGSVTLEGLRGGESVTFKLKGSEWGLTVRPDLPAEALTLLNGGDLLLSESSEGDTLGDLKARTSKVKQRCGRPAQAWVLLRWGQALLKINRRSEAKGLFENALLALRPEESAAAWIQEALAETAAADNDYEGATAAHRRALAIREKHDEDGLPAARSLYEIARIVLKTGRLDDAEESLRRCLAIREKACPGSLEVAACLSTQGVVAAHRGRMEQAEKLYLRALEIRETIAPGSRHVADSLNHLGIVAYSRGDLAAVEDYFRRALDIYRRVMPDSTRLATIVGNLGVVARTRGDLAKAESFYRDALRILERKAPEGPEAARTLNNMGIVYYHRRNYEEAESFFLRALEIRDRIQPESLQAARSIHSLGDVAFARGDLAAAAERYGRALKIEEEEAPGSMQCAETLSNLGVVAKAADDLQASAAFFDRALNIQKKHAPEGLEIAITLLELGDLADRMGDTALAETRYRECLRIRERLAPRSLQEAEAAYDLASHLRNRGDREGALSLYARAIRALEGQVGMLGGSEEMRAAYRATYIDYYRDYIDLLIAAGHEKQAFDVLERSRARQLLAMLAERDLVFAIDIPESLDREFRMTRTEYGKAMAALGSAAGEDEAKIGECRRALEDVRGRYARLKEDIRKASPSLADLRYPEPLTLVSARALLEEGTVLLTYSVGEAKSHLFVLDAGGLKTAAIGAGRNQLARRIRRFRSEIERRAETPSASTLSELLLRPAEAAISRARRLLVVPDGPLHFLPFSALEAPEGGRRLIEGLPVHTVVSLTVYKELIGDRSSPREPTLTAFGNPSYPTMPPEGTVPEGIPPELRSALLRGACLDPIPFTGTEVRSIGAWYPGRANLQLGPDATEEAARSVGKGASHIHFACHGIADERSPLNSCLLLTIPEDAPEGAENGLLEAWEIFESVRIDADLLVLSACETALGREMGGEGIVGLTRAFQYAGARSIVASLWSVSDLSTAEFMRRFYGYQREGKPTDEALRRTQVDFIAGPIRITDATGKDREIDASHPFYWGAFELIGDWR